MKKFAVVGSPIEHSLSPVLHQAVFAAYGCDATYERVEIERGRLEHYVKDFDGLSVTMPLKYEAYQLAHERDNFALETGVINTLVKNDGIFYGANTDVAGFLSLFDELGISTVDSAIVLGNGATARSAIVALSRTAREIRVMARNHEIALPLDPQYLTWGSALEADVIISTLPHGAADTLTAGSGLLIDVLYSNWPTPFADRWPGRVVSGIELLIHQAIHQSALFLAPQQVDLGRVRQIMRSALEA